jgi:hypothetical protein
VRKDGDYALEWAKGVVKAFWDTCPRGCDIVCAGFNIEPIDVAFFLVRRKRSWENFKKLAKMADRLSRNVPNSPLDPYLSVVFGRVKTYGKDHGWVK